MSKLKDMVERAENARAMEEGVRRVYSQLVMLGVPPQGNPPTNCGVWYSPSGVFVQDTYDLVTGRTSGYIGAYPAVTHDGSAGRATVRYTVRDSYSSAELRTATEERAVEMLASWWFNRLKGEQV